MKIQHGRPRRWAPARRAQHRPAPARRTSARQARNRAPLRARIRRQGKRTAPPAAASGLRAARAGVREPLRAGLGQRRHGAPETPPRGEPRAPLPAAAGAPVRAAHQASAHAEPAQPRRGASRPGQLQRRATAPRQTRPSCANAERQRVCCGSGECGASGRYPRYREQRRNRNLATGEEFPCGKQVRRGWRQWAPAKWDERRFGLVPAAGEQDDLFLQKIERPVVEKDEVGGGDFPGERKLLGDACCGEVGRDSARMQP